MVLSGSSIEGSGSSILPEVFVLVGSAIQLFVRRCAAAREHFDIRHAVDLI